MCKVLKWISWKTLNKIGQLDLEERQVIQVYVKS